MVILLNVRAVVVDLCTVIFGILQRFYPAAVCTLIFRPPLLVSGGYNNINGHSDFSRGVINGQIIGVSVLVQTAEYRDQLRRCDQHMPPVSRFGGGSRAKKKQGIIEKLKVFFEKYFGLGIAELKAEEER